MKILSMPSVGIVNYADIIKDGIINDAYAVTGDITQYSGYVQIARTANTNGGYIVGIDFTDINTLVFDYQRNITGINVTVYIDSTVVYNDTVVADASRKTASINVSAYTGVHNMNFIVGNNTGSYKVYNLLGT